MYEQMTMKKLEYFQSNMFPRRNKYTFLLIFITIFCLIATIFIILKGKFSSSNCSSSKCVIIKKSNATINTKDIYQTFDFNAEWIKDGKFWNNFYEERFYNVTKLRQKKPLKVFIVPHSHNDPGWLKTFTDYYDLGTRKILNTILEKLTEHEDMRFIWSEVSFLDLWWSKATAAQQKAFKKLITSGRLEIVTGGWVMTDEANVHLYGMLDQLIEGHQWVKNHFGVTPKIGWSIDPFGQGSTVPHLLAKSGFDGAIIQRIHYNWKEWLARNQAGDFFWKPYWNNSKSSRYTLLTHNMPFDLYSTTRSCGPDAEVCDKFNFYKSDEVIHMNNFKIVNEGNVKTFADDLILEYSKTASLFPHNVALVLIGDDFTFRSSEEFMQQYENYKTIIDFVNKNSHKFYNGAKIQFGTPSDYFQEITKRQKNNFPSLVGDFFPYADIFNSGMPAYWTGYYTTRPFYKLLSRTLEHNLRSAEILFSIGYNRAKQSEMSYFDSKRMEKDFEGIIEARRNLGLFNHHDAITGTSQALVMHDHLSRLHKSISSTLDVQKKMIEFLLQPTHVKERNFMVPELDVKKTEAMIEKKIIRVTKENPEQKVVIFNSLASKRFEVLSLYVSDANVQVLDHDKKPLTFQINPILKDGKIADDVKELLVIVELKGLTIYTLTLKYAENLPRVAAAKVETDFNDENEISIENTKLKLYFNRFSGFLELIFDKNKQAFIKSELSFGAYESSFFQSGAYLFKPERELKTILPDYLPIKVILIKGRLASYATVIYGETLTCTVKIYNTKSHLDDAIIFDNTVDVFEKGSEFFMRIKTSMNSTQNGDEPEFFTDLNGFQWMPRKKVSKIGVEGNYYPITSSAFIQDNSKRMTLITTHSKGVTSREIGELEVMLDRRPSGDDGRGLNEGVSDSVKMKHEFIFVLEDFSNESSNYQTPSLFVHHLTNCLNYPINKFFVDVNFENQLESMKELLNFEFPCDTNLLNVRTLTDNELDWLPKQESILIFHRVGYECQMKNEGFLKEICKQCGSMDGIHIFKDLYIKQVNKASLTGTHVNNYRIKSFKKDIPPMEPMEVTSFYVTFY